MQLGVVQQIVVILLIDIAQDVVHQRFVVVGADGARIDVLHLTGGKMDAQPLLFRRGKRFTRQLLQGARQLAGGVAHVLRHILGAKVGQRIPFAHAAHGNRAVQADKTFSRVSQAHVMAGQRLLQHARQQRRYAGVKRLFADKRVQRPLLAQLPQQIGQASANGDLAPEQLHAVARTGLEGELITLKTFAYVNHVAL